MHDSDILRLALEQTCNSVPVLYIHSFEQPFCSNPICPCQRTKQQAIGLFVQIIEGKLDLEQAAGFAERQV